MQPPPTGQHMYHRAANGGYVSVQTMDLLEIHQEHNLALYSHA